MSGSFLARDFEKSYERMQKLIEEAVTEIFQSGGANFLSTEPLASLGFTRGSKMLSSCFQYEVRNHTGAKLLNIKAYDKILDLVGREATHLVSTRLSTILASGKDPGAFESMIRRNQRCGVTRLEVSICREALDRHNLLQCDYRGTWHEKMCTAMGQLVEYVLNDRDILELT